MNDLSRISNDTLQSEFEIAHQNRKDLEAELFDVREWEKGLQAELDRRKLEAFWRDHPGLRLEVGDKLVITQELKDYKQEQVRQGNTYRLGEIYEVDFVSPNSKDMPIRIESRASSTSVPLDIARHMREAYLQQERAK